MYKFFYISCIFCLTFASAFAQTPERKIRIENGIYYYVTVDDNSQIATLYTGKTDEKLSSSKALALPAGRGLSAETNPLAWDIRGNDLIAINFLDHVLNDRNEAIKRIALDELKPWAAGMEVEDMVARSVDQEMYALNEPYIFVKKRSKYLNRFYFDGILVGDDYWMVMTNNDELTVWKLEDKEWKHSEVLKFPVTGFFHLMGKKGKPYLVTQTGGIYAVNLTQLNRVAEDKDAFSLNEIVLVDNRDVGKIFYMKNAVLNADKSLNEILESFAVELIKE